MADDGPALEDGIQDNGLDALVRRADLDRWLASRFISDPLRRAEVVAVYAFNDVLARVGATVSQPLIGEIRLAWWRERIDDLFAGRSVPNEPVLQALVAGIAEGRLPGALFEVLIQTRHLDLDPEPVADSDALARYLDGTAGAVMGLAMRVLSPEAPLASIVQAARAWGLAGLFRARGQGSARNRRWTPPEWGAPDDAALTARVHAEVAAALVSARRDIKALPVVAFPAVAYATLAPVYARAHAPGELELRLRLLWATATGRL